MSMQKVCCFILVSLMLSACGGGGGGGSSSSTAATTTATKSTTSTVTTTTTSSSVSVAPDFSNKTRVLDASGVEGLNYECGSTTATTSQGGVFECNSFPISFYLGEIPLGSVSVVKDKVIYTTDLLSQARGAAHHPDVTKLSMLLQSLDSDKDLTNGIKITQESSDLANQYFYADTNLSTISLEDFEATLKELATQNKEILLINAKDAQDNLTSSLAIKIN